MYSLLVWRCDRVDGFQTYAADCLTGRTQSSVPKRLLTMSGSLFSTLNCALAALTDPPIAVVRRLHPGIE